MNKKIFIYDFDGTLTPYPISKVGVLKDCGFPDGMMDPKFMALVRERRLSKNLDVYSACYEVLLEVLKENNVPTTKDNFRLGAKDLEYNLGVLDFFDRTKEYNVSNYLVSSSSKDFLEGTDVSKYFEEIYATTFKYDENGSAIETDFLMSDRRKVEVIKNIIKANNYDENDASDVVCVGDGLTDLYAMEFVREHGGKSIFVYLDEESESYKSAQDVHVVDYFVKGDYTLDGEFSLIFEKLYRGE